MTITWVFINLMHWIAYSPNILYGGKTSQFIVLFLPFVFYRCFIALAYVIFTCIRCKCRCCINWANVCHFYQSLCYKSLLMQNNHLIVLIIMDNWELIDIRWILHFLFVIELYWLSFDLFETILLLVFLLRINFECGWSAFSFRDDFDTHKIEESFCTAENYARFAYD